MGLLRFLLRQSLLIRLTALLLIPAAGIAWMVQGFSLGEWCLAVFLLALLLLKDWVPTRARKKVHVDVD
jgi:hypothetical protein